MASAKRRDAPNLNPDDRPTKKIRKETTGNLPSAYASLRNKDLLDSCNTRRVPEQDSLDRGFIRATVRHVKWDEQTKSATLALQLAHESTSHAPDGVNEQRVLDCIMSHPRFGVSDCPVVDQVVDVALTNPSILRTTESKTRFGFKLVFNNILLRLHSQILGGETRIRQFGHVTQTASITRQNMHQIRPSGSNHGAPSRDRNGPPNPRSAPPEVSKPGSSEQISVARSIPTGQPGHAEVNQLRRHHNSKKDRHKEQRSHPMSITAGQTVNDPGPVARPHKEARRQRSKQTSSVNIPMTNDLGTERLVQLASEEADRAQSPEQDGKEQTMPDRSDDESGHVVYHLGVSPTIRSPLNSEPVTNDGVSVDFKGIDPKYGPFISLKKVLETKPKTQVNLVALIVGQNEIKKSKDYSLHLKLTDPSLSPGHWLNITLFHPIRAFLPDIHTGQMIILTQTRQEGLRKLDCVGYHDQFKWRGYDQGTKRLFFNNLGPDQAGGAPCAAVDDALLEELHKLADTMKTQVYKPIPLPSSDKHRTLSEFVMLGNNDMFIDATIEVQGVDLGGDGRRRVNIFVTDYTRNSRFKTFDFPKADPEYTLQIDVWWDNRLYDVARSLVVGKYYRITNMVSDDRRGSGFIFAKLPDNPGTDITQVVDPEDPHLAELLRRKESCIKDRRVAMIAKNFDPEIYCGNPQSPAHRETIEKVGPPVPITQATTSTQLKCSIEGSGRDFGYATQNPGSLRCRLRGRVIDFLPTDRKDMIIISCMQCGFKVGGSSYAKQICFRCKKPDHLVYEVKFCLLFVDEDDNYVPIQAFGEEAMRLFGLETFNFKDDTFDISGVLKTIELKLGSIMGDLWSLIDSDQPLLAAGAPFDVPALARLVNSPWVDIGVQSWPSIRDFEGKSYHLVDCVFD